MLLYPQISPTVSLHPCQGMDAMASTRWVSLGTKTPLSFFLLFYMEKPQQQINAVHHLSNEAIISVSWVLLCKSSTQCIIKESVKLCFVFTSQRSQSPNNGLYIYIYIRKTFVTEHDMTNKGWRTHKERIKNKIYIYCPWQKQEMIVCVSVGQMKTSSQQVGKCDWCLYEDYWNKHFSFNLFLFSFSHVGLTWALARKTSNLSGCWSFEQRAF